MGDPQFFSKVAQIAAKEPRYAAAAYDFVSDAVNYTVSRLAAHRHVSARELLEGLRALARSRFGVMAHEVLVEWGLRSAADVGNVVYLLIDAEIFSASERDSREEFDVDFALAEPPPENAGPLPVKCPRIDR